MKQLAAAKVKLGASAAKLQTPAQIKSLANTVAGKEKPRLKKGQCKIFSFFSAAIFHGHVSSGAQD